MEVGNDQVTSHSALENQIKFFSLPMTLYSFRIYEDIHVP